MKERAKTWSVEDEQYLSKNWILNTPWTELITALKRKKGAIRDKSRRMGLRGRRKYKNGIRIYKSQIDGMCYSVHISGGGYLTTHIDGKHLKIHRVEMEKFIGRGLFPYERVHHKNGIKTDNRIENLMIYDHNMQHAHIDTDRAERAELFIKNMGLWDNFVNGGKL